MRLAKVLMFLVLCASCLLIGCRKKSTPLRPLSELTVQERRSIFLVTDGALFISVGGSPKGADFIEVALPVLRKIDEHYSLEAGTAAVIWSDGKDRKWQLGMEGRLAVLSLTERESWTISDIENLLGETISRQPITAQDESETIKRLVQDIRRAKDASERYDSLNALIEFGDAAVEPLVAALEDKDPYVRGFATYGLSKIGDRRAIQPLVEILDDYEVFDFDGLEPLYVAHPAAEALVNFGNSSVLPSLKAALAVAKDKEKIEYWKWDSLEKSVANVNFVKTLERIIPVLEARAVKEAQHVSTVGLSAVELARLLVRYDDKPEVAIDFADALSAADDARLEHIQLLSNVALDLERSGHNVHAAHFSKAVLRLCVRMMNGDIIGTLPFNAARVFADLSLTKDPTSIRRGAQKILGDGHGARAFEIFNAAIDKRRQAALGIDESLEKLILRIPKADVAHLDPEVARFWQLRTEPAAEKAELTKNVAVVIAPELWKAIHKYLEVPDKGDPNAVLTPAERKKLGEAYSLAQEYAWEHPDDPWGEYIAAYGMASLFFDVPANLLEVSRKLPEKQAVLAKRLIDAKAKGVPGSREFFRALGDIWQDFAIFVEKFLNYKSWQDDRK